MSAPAGGVVRTLSGLSPSVGRGLAVPRPGGHRDTLCLWDSAQSPPPMGT